MKRIWNLAGVFLCLGLYGGPAAAAYVTGNDLARFCQSDKSADVLSCVNYVAGVIDYHLMMQSLGTEPVVDFCLPARLSEEEAAVVVARYLKRSPQDDSFIAASAVLMALQKAYPCARR